jgi:hypothetical protein
MALQGARGLSQKSAQLNKLGAQEKLRRVATRAEAAEQHAGL